MVEGMNEMGGDEDDRPSAEIGNSALHPPKKFDRSNSGPGIFIPSQSRDPLQPIGHAQLKVETLEPFLAERLFRSFAGCLAMGLRRPRDQLVYLLRFMTDSPAKGPVADLAVRKFAEHAAERDL